MFINYALLHQSGEQVPAEGEIPRDVSRDFRPKVAKQHAVSSLRYAGVTIFGELVSARAVSWLDNKNRKLF